MAKAPVPGAVKTRLALDVGAEAAAELAALALLDTLDACEEAFGPARCHLAVAGDLGAALRGAELARRLTSWTCWPQRGDGLGARIAAAHDDVGRVSRGPVVQVGMDTPQLGAGRLLEVAALCDAGDRAVLGPAADGGWWVLGLRDPRWARCLVTVPMSGESTGRLTVAALSRAGARVVLTAAARDVDGADDARRVAASDSGRFAKAWRELSRS